jgi:hypothetical protein
MKEKKQIETLLLEIRVTRALAVNLLKIISENKIALPFGVKDAVNTLFPVSEKKNNEEKN